LASIPIIAIVTPTLSATLGPFSVANWAALDLTLALGGLTAPLLVTIEHDPDGLDAWQSCAALDFTNPLETGDLQLRYGYPVLGGSPRVRITLASSGLFTLATGSLDVT